MSSAPTSDSAPAGAQSPDQPARTLKAGALHFRDTVVMSLASSGPTQSIAVTLAALLATVGYASFLPLTICFIPMLGIAIGYQRLNAWQPSAGATYSWVGRALNPHAGFFSGWIMLMYYCVGTTSLTIPLGTYFLSFFSDSAANNAYAVAAVGSAFDILVLVVAALGIKLSARFQWGWAIFEYGLLVGFTIAAIVGIYGNHLHNTVKISSSWFTVSGAGGFSALISGVLLAIFLYSGWDTAAYVGEETEGKKAGPAAITSVVILYVIYTVVILALQGVAPNKAMQDNAGNILAYVGDLIGGGFWKNVMIVAVLGGTLASLPGSHRQRRADLVRHGPGPDLPALVRRGEREASYAVERHDPVRRAELGVPVGHDAVQLDRHGPGQHCQHARPDGGDLLPAHRECSGLVLPPGHHEQRGQLLPRRVPARPGRGLHALRYCLHLLPGIAHRGRDRFRLRARGRRPGALVRLSARREVVLLLRPDDKLRRPRRGGTEQALAMSTERS
jgi:hypothetical protein